MRKFTVFTVILTIITVVVVAEIVVNKYLPDLSGDAQLILDLPESLDLGKSIETNVLGGGFDNYLGADAGEGVTYIPETDEVVGSIVPTENPGTPPFFDTPDLSLPEDNDLSYNVPQDLNTGGLEDFEDQNFVSPVSNVYLREDHIKSAGFVGAYLEKENPDGNLFKTILIDDLYDVEVEKSAVRTADQLLAKVYVFKIGINADISETYNLIKIRASEPSGNTVNETSEFGAASFYLNDERRSGTAFLTVRIGGFIYAFSYPKEYHSQIKNLIQLLEWELG